MRFECTCDPSRIYELTVIQEQEVIVDKKLFLRTPKRWAKG